MPIITSSKNYIEINGRVYADADPDASSDRVTEGIFVDAQITPSTAVTTANGGSGTDFQRVAAGLTKFDIVLTLLCDDARWIDDLKILLNNLGIAAEVTVEKVWGGRKTGNLRHRGKFLMQPPPLPMVAVIRDTPWMLNITGESTEAPEYNALAGAVYP